MVKADENRLFQLPNGLAVQILRLNHVKLEVVRGSKEIGKQCGWLLGERNCDYGEYPAVMVRVGDEQFYLVYRPLTYREAEELKKLIRINPKKTMRWLLLTFYDKTAYPFYHQTTRLLLETCITGLPPKIGALTFNDNPQEYGVV